MIEEAMQALEESFKGDVPRFKRVLSQGWAREVIRRELERLRPDLLVVGTHGRTGVSHALLGSVAEHLLSNPPCDV
jgi:nucleotide-binding universal stress UspA family protein